MPIPLSDAIAQLRDELRQAVRNSATEDPDIVFLPKEIELELGVTLDTEAKVGGGFKLLAFIDTSAEAKATRSTVHKIRFKLDVTDRVGNRLKVVSTDQTDR